MAAMSVSGVISGMDWESMIDEIITNAAAPAQPKVNKKTNLTNKKSLLEEMKVTMNSLQSSLSPLKLPSTYKAKTIDIENIGGTGSYKGILTATVNADAEVNVWDVKVNKLATAQTNRSNQITSSTLASTLNGLTSSTFYINMGGQKVGIEVNASDTLQALKSRINNTLKTLDNPLAVTASVVDNKLILKSDDTGLGTRTASETINYSSSGVNRLSNISVTSSDASNLKITKGSKSYTYGTDFTVANGNEIRWKQYDRGTEVALNDTVSVKYRMAAGDVYTNKGTYGTSEAEISRFEMIKKGTLGSRVKIVDDNGNTYTYGKDFTITDNKVVWLEAEESYTNEPDSYTVSYSETTTETVSATGTKAGEASVPSSYTVSYTKQLLAPVSVTVNTNSYQPINALNFSNVASLDGLSSTERSAVTDVKYIKPDDSTEFTLTDGTTEYVYGQDYILRSPRSTSTYPILSWNGDANGTRYIDDYAGEAVSNVNVQPTSGTLQLSYTHTYKSDNGISSDVLTAAGTDYDNIIITDSNNNTYRYGTDFTINNGAIEWYIDGPEVDDDISTADFANIQAGYNASIGADEDTDLPTITLLDADGVVRTYFDPADRSMFTMTATDSETGDTVTYEYGRDYVIRVNDSGDGYVFSWAVTGDKNRDGSTDIKDANTEVTTYTAAKGISTSGWKAAPSYDSEYTFGFTYDSTTTETGTVNSTDTDKSLATVLNGTAIDSSEYSSITITDGTNTYTYGTDWEIDESGNISWIDQSSGADAPNNPGSGKGYTLYYEAFSALTASGTYDGSDSQTVSITVDSGSGNYGDTALSYEQILSDLSLTSSSSASDIAEKFADNFSLSDGDGNSYTYGTDYTISMGSDEDSDTEEHNIVINWITALSNNDFTLTYSGRGNAGEVITTNGVTRSAKDTITPDTSSALTGLYFSFNSASDITITDGTNTYSLGTDFTIGQSDDSLLNPVIVWKEGSAWYSQDTTSATSFDINVTASDGTTTTYTGTRSTGSDDLTLNLGSVYYYSESDFEGGTTTITQGSKTFYENEDFMIMDDDEGHAQVYWLNDRSGGTEWYYPNPGSSYTINHTDSSGNTTSYTAYRSASTALNMYDYGMTTANGSLTVQYGEKSGMLLDAEPDYQTDSDGNYVLDTDGNKIPVANTDGHAAIKAEYAIDITNSGNGNYTFNWVMPTLTSRSGLPSYGDELTVEYEYDANTFEITGEAADLLGLNSDVTEAQDAELEVDGETVTRASNDIGADYDNELIKGVTLHLKNTGEVSLDISHDAEKAVESIQTFVDTYNDLMSWMNTRMTEKELDEDTAATVDSDDFRMRWGLLHGSSLLRNTKSKMRSLASQNFTFSFTQRKSSSEIYGTMAFNGLKTSSTLRLRIGTKYVDVTIDPSDTLQTIAAKINDDTKGGAMNDIYYDDEGNKLQTPLLRVSIDNDVLSINSTSSDEITMSGSAAMNALKMNYTYKGLYQIGIETTSDDYGKSGELVFDADEFMTALEDNPDEVQALMLKFVTQFDSWTKEMLNSSATGETSGTLTREIDNIQSQIDSINEYLETYQERLDRMEESLRTRYGNTETQFAKLSQQANSIAAILNQLNGTASGGGYGQTSS